MTMMIIDNCDDGGGSFDNSEKVLYVVFAIYDCYGYCFCYYWC